MAAVRSIINNAGYTIADLKKELYKLDTDTIKGEVLIETEDDIKYTITCNHDYKVIGDELMYHHLLEDYEAQDTEYITLDHYSVYQLTDKEGIEIFGEEPVEEVEEDTTDEEVEEESPEGVEQN